MTIFDGLFAAHRRSVGLLLQSMSRCLTKYSTCISIYLWDKTLLTVCSEAVGLGIQTSTSCMGLSQTTVSSWPELEPGWCFQQPLCQQRWTFRCSALEWHSQPTPYWWLHWHWPPLRVCVLFFFTIVIDHLDDEDGIYLLHQRCDHPLWWWISSSLQSSSSQMWSIIQRAGRPPFWPWHLQSQSQNWASQENVLLLLLLLFRSYIISGLILLRHIDPVF